MSDNSAFKVESVIIVEDHKDAARVLRQVVEEVFNAPKIDLAQTYTQGLQCLQQQRYSIALLDLGLPDGDGLELIRYLSAQRSDTLIIVTTIFNDEEHLFDALRFGASGYLLKGHSPAELAAYLEDAVAGRPALSPRIANSMLEFFRQEQAGPTKTEAAPNPDQLTNRELEVLSLIAKGCGVKEVSELLDITANTVSHHIKNLYSKLNIHNRAEATAAAVQLNIFKPQ